MRGTGDWKVARTRRLESLRYIAVQGRSPAVKIRTLPRDGRSFSSQNGLVFFSHGNGSPSESDVLYPSTFVLWFDRRCRTLTTKHRPFKTIGTSHARLKPYGRNPKPDNK